MKYLNSKLMFFLLIAAIGTGCKEESPLDGEQYIKQVYIVGADETSGLGLATVEIPYNDQENTTTNISVATGGSRNIDKAITVTIKEAGTDAIDTYNFKYLEDDDIKYQLLSSQYYEIPDYSATIKAGEVYATIPVKVQTAGLNCDSLYALTFQIESVSDPDAIAIREVDTVLILNFKFINDFSGSYQMSGYYYPWTDNTASGDSVAISTLRELKAADQNTVRFYHLATTESSSNLENNGIILTVSSDNTVTLLPWRNLEITDGGGSYNPENQIFSIWYNYQSNGTQFRFSGTLVCSDN